MVQPVPGPVPTSNEAAINNPLKGKNQNLILFNRGKHMSWAPSNKGSKILPNPPIKIGITIKKIIRKAWRVTTLL